MKRHLFLVSIIFLVGCATRPGLPYPTAYQELQLPEYKKAWVENNGRATDTLETSGLRLKLRTRASISDTRSYYEQTLFDSGWTSPEEPPAGWETLYLRLFEKNDTQLQLLIEELQTEGRNIIITVSKKSE